MTNDTYVKMAYEKFSRPVQKGTLGESLLYAYEQMCRDHKFTLLYPEFPDFMIYELVKRGHCRVKKIPSPIYPSWMAIQMRYNSPYIRIFSRM